MKKRILSLLLVVIMVVSLLPTAAFAETENCPDCNGTGKQGCSECDYSGLCYMCEGTGACRDCDGIGQCRDCNGKGCDDCGNSGTCKSCDGKIICYMCGGNGKCNYCDNCTKCGGTDKVTVYTITNNTPQEDAETNHGYIAIDKETAAGGETVTITAYPNDGYRLTRLAYKRDTSDSSEQSYRSNPALPSPIFGAAAPLTGMKIVANERLAIDKGSFLALVDATEISADKLDEGGSQEYPFSMPAYPIIVMAEFELINPQWSDDDWKPFDIGTGEWTFAVLSEQAGSYDVSIREEKTHPNHKQLKVASWGENILASPYPGIDLIIEWDMVRNKVTIPEQYTGLIEISTCQKVMVQDLNGYIGSDYPSYYDYYTKTFFIPVIYYISDGYFGYEYETLKMKEPSSPGSEKLKHDATDEDGDFRAAFETNDTEISYKHDEDGWVALVHATDSDLNTVALYVNLEEGSTEIPAGEYSIDYTFDPDTVLASSGVVNGNQVTYSFAGKRNTAGQITTPIWFMVNGTVTVSYEGNDMTMVVDAKNSYGKDIDVTITKTIPAKHNITDATTDSNGSVLVDQTPAEEGSTVTLTVMPKDGYKLKAGTLKAVYNDGGEKEIELTQNPTEKNKFTFTVPTADVTVTAKFVKAEKTFKAVWNSKTGVLSFFYDKLNHMGEGIAVFDELPTEAAAAEDWPYNSLREDVVKVEIDPSVADYKDLKSTAYMFNNMFSAAGITGAEYLKVDNVTNMKLMFGSFGFSSTELVDVPDVSTWNTERVTDLSQMFQCYGYWSQKLNFSLDLSGWDLSNAERVDDMFFYAGADAEAWEVCIPYMTGILRNTQDNWYGKYKTVSAAPLTGKQFTLIYSIPTRNFNHSSDSVVIGNKTAETVETNPDTGAPVMNFVAIAVVLGAAFVLSKKH